ncbi:diguanylate cyclase [Maribrevibacterium harenarium]|uniref:diguanylate cyclase n=1 Tax=Maribrevibacterium harenarium TaxID=2589817 RepID=A0A501X0U2_9GAMM|nr:GGDEF domain-containing protein [Maribrevibacterium harenarium]TPE54327.1 diguanylate cyclase [Maribrevibacterium harenarium]
MDVTQEKLIEALRKTISRTSMLAEGNDPEIDKALQQMRLNIAKTDDVNVVLESLKSLEPHVLSFDDKRLERAQAFRNTLHDLLDVLESAPQANISLTAKKQFEANLRSHWQTISSWPGLLLQFSSLVEASLTTPTSEEKRPPSLINRLFGRKETRSTETKHSHEDIMVHICHTLAGLIQNLNLPDNYQLQIQDLIQALSGNRDIQQLPALLDEVINLVMVAVGKTQDDLAGYLNQLNKQLASINASIISSYKSQKTLSNQRQDFDSHLTQQVQETSAMANSASDLDSLKSLINERMSTITETMSRYREDMKKQEQQAAKSISQLKHKVNKMEQDASHLRSKMQQKIAEAMTDELTKLPNRASYQEAVMTLCTSARASQTPLCLAVLDIDRFKSINDTWGHLAGDKVLRLVPRQAQTALRKQDVLFRYGGEEFVLLLPALSLEQALATAERVRAAVEQTPFNMNGEPVSITISIGVSLFDGNESSEELFARADKNLYRAKTEGRNRVIGDNS